jgi:predicted transcriptional regulator
MIYLLGLKDDYESDGHVITEALAFLPRALKETEDLAKGYDQINSSVGQLATDTLIGDTKALASGSGADDSAFATEQEALAQLADDRDAAAAKIKQTLSDAAAGYIPDHREITSGLWHVKELLERASKLAGN